MIDEIDFACLAPPAYPLKGGDKCWSAGWGEVDEFGRGPSLVLKEVNANVRLSKGNLFNHVQVDLKILSDSECAQSGIGRFFRGRSPETMICAGNGRRNTCHGDSGGPLICIDDNQPMLTGITSWGHSDCSYRGAPAVYTEIGNSKIHSFIMEHLDKTSKCVVRKHHIQLI